MHVLVSSPLWHFAFQPSLLGPPASQAAGAAAKPVPCFHTAQAIRASLLASATAALSCPRSRSTSRAHVRKPIERQGPRAFGVPQDRSRAVNQEHAQIGVAPLADGAQMPAGARRVFARREAQVAGEVPRRGKALHIADGGDECGRRQQPDSGDCAQVVHDEAASERGYDLRRGCDTWR
jgi:hypothetical protein